MNWYLKCLKQYADFRGRARRKEYWMFTLFNVIFSIVFSSLDVMLGLTSSQIGLGVLSGLYSLFVLIPGLAVCVRRLHDIGKSGWNYLFILIPIFGSVLLFVWFVKEGERGSNSWGEDPKQVESNPIP